MITANEIMAEVLKERTRVSRAQSVRVRDGGGETLHAAGRAPVVLNSQPQFPLGFPLWVITTAGCLIWTELKLWMTLLLFSTSILNFYQALFM